MDGPEYGLVLCSLAEAPASLTDDVLPALTGVAV